MLKKLLILLCLGAFIAVATVGGCKKEEEEPEPKDNGDEPGDENGEENGDENNGD